jgi:ribose-phosphate pyrophosphokinase
MIRTGGSLLQAGKAYLEAGATAVHAVASHLVLPPGALDKLRASGVFSSILGSNSHPGSQQLMGEPGAVFSVAGLMTEAIARM